MSCLFRARGHVCVLSPGFPPIAHYENDGQRWEPGRERPCVACGLPPTPEGYDACLGFVEGASSACCGHGVEEPYGVVENDREVRGIEAARYFAEHARGRVNA